MTMTMITMNTMTMNMLMDTSMVKWMLTFMVTVRDYELYKYQRQECSSLLQFNLPLHGLAGVPDFSLMHFTTLEMFLLPSLSG